PAGTARRRRRCRRAAAPRGRPRRTGGGTRRAAARRAGEVPMRRTTGSRASWGLPSSLDVELVDAVVLTDPVDQLLRALAGLVGADVAVEELVPQRLEVRAEVVPVREVPG